MSSLSMRMRRLEARFAPDRRRTTFYVQSDGAPADLVESFLAPHEYEPSRDTLIHFSTLYEDSAGNVIAGTTVSLLSKLETA